MFDQHAVQQYARLLLLCSGEGDALDNIQPYTTHPGLKDFYPTRRMQREIEDRSRDWKVEDARLRPELEVIAARLSEVCEWIERFKAYDELPKLAKAQRWVGDKRWVQDFCRRWGLSVGGEVPAWAEKIVVDTLDRTTRLGFWSGWHVPVTYCAPEKLPKVRIPRCRLQGMSAAVQQYLIGGQKVMPAGYRAEAVAWAARRAFGGESWGSLAAEMMAVSPPTMTAEEQADTIFRLRTLRLRAVELLTLAGLAPPRKSKQ